MKALSNLNLQKLLTVFNRLSIEYANEHNPEEPGRNMLSGYVTHGAYHIYEHVYAAGSLQGHEENESEYEHVQEHIFTSHNEFVNFMENVARYNFDLELWESEEECEVTGGFDVVERDGVKMSNVEAMFLEYAEYGFTLPIPLLEEQFAHVRAHPELYEE